MEFNFTRVMNFDGALRGMRNPLESWEKSDSYFNIVDLSESYDIFRIVAKEWSEHDGSTQNMSIDDYFEWLSQNGILTTNENDLAEIALIGPKDMGLAQKLIKAGSEHRKFMRQIFVCVDISAALFFFKEFDTYKVGTVANSTSTMHKIHSTNIIIENFENDDFEPNLVVKTYDENGKETGEQYTVAELFGNILFACEMLRKNYEVTKEKAYWKELIRALPESWLQTRTITMSYENIYNMINHRENHKLNEWSGKDMDRLTNFISWAKELPYAQELLFIKRND